MSIIKSAGAIAALATTTATLAQGTFHHVRIGDIDGFGFLTGTTPGLNGEPDWPFNSPFDDPPSCPIDGSCSNFILVNAAGNPINVDGMGILTQGDFLPDLDCSDVSCGINNIAGTRYNSDEFDNREVAEITGGPGNPPTGAYIEVSGATDLGSSGSGWTDVAVSGNADGWNYCSWSPSQGTTICGAGQAKFYFDFSAAGADPNQPLYFNAVYGDYDVDEASDIVRITTSSGTTYDIPVVTQNNTLGEDGLIQEVTAVIPFAAVFPNWPTSTDGYLSVEFTMNLEPFTAYDFAELSITPLVPSGCCCVEISPGVWTTTEMSETDCIAQGGIYQGDGVGCTAPTPPMGACCTAAGCDYTADCDCDLMGGVFYAGMSCQGAPCAPEGCCCFQDSDTGTWWYQMMSEANCYQMSGYYAGDGYECGGEVVPMGACCVEHDDGEQLCFETSLCHCDALSGMFFDGWDCDDDPVLQKCPPPEVDGACCYFDMDAGCFLCVMTTHDDCVNGHAYGKWHGVDSSCDDANVTCCRRMGACCIAGTCVFTFEDACLESDGEWNSAVTCDNANCPPDCPSDITGDDVVDIDDLLALLGGIWGPCP